MATKNTGGAAVDGLYKGKAFGSIAQRLLANDMNYGALRGNATLRKDEWKDMDDAVVSIAKRRLVGVDDLVSRGLVYNLTNALGTTVFEYEDASDMEAAQINMDGVARGRNDRVEFDMNYLPLPIVHKDFQISTRVLNASRNKGQPLDVMQAQMASRLVAEKIEEILFTGASTYTFGGGTLYGYTDFPHRNTVTLATNWDDSAMTGPKILDDVIACKQASLDDRHFGPWMLYVPTGYDAILDDDYSTSYPTNSIRSRIREVDGIEDVKVADFLTAHNVLLVELAPETARIIMGMQPTPVEWETEGGLVVHMKVMAIIVPQLRADQDDRAGIIHLS